MTFIVFQEVANSTLNKSLHFKKRETVAKEDEEGIGIRNNLLNKGKVGFAAEGFEDEFLIIPDSQRGRRGRRRGGFFDGQIEEFSELQGVEILGVENGGSGLEDVAGGEVNGGHAAADDAVSLEHPDVESGAVGVGGGVEAEEVGKRGTSDAASDDANGGA